MSGEFGLKVFSPLPQYHDSMPGMWLFRQPYVTSRMSIVICQLWDSGVKLIVVISFHLTCFRCCIEVSSISSNWHEQRENSDPLLSLLVFLCLGKWMVAIMKDDVNAQDSSLRRFLRVIFFLQGSYSISSDRVNLFTVSSSAASITPVMRLASCWWTIPCLQILRGVLGGFQSSHISSECTPRCPGNCVTTKPVDLAIQSHPSHSRPDWENLSDWESLLEEVQSLGQQTVILHTSCHGHLAWDYKASNLWNISPRL